MSLRTSLIWAYAAALLLVSTTAGCSEGEPASASARLVRIETIEVRVSPFGPVVLLRAQGKAVPIFVDAVVAESIHGALTGQKFARPLSHDLMHTILHAFGGKVSQAVITLKGATYYADLTVDVQGATKVFDSRSSDAIALAIHFKAPVLVSKELLDRADTAPEEREERKPGERRLRGGQPA